MAAYGGFNHNDQSCRVLTFLEQRYASFDGLNLSWESLSGLVKHNGPITDTPACPILPALTAIGIWRWPIMPA
jgi:dGTPase